MHGLRNSRQIQLQDLFLIDVNLLFSNVVYAQSKYLFGIAKWYWDKDIHLIPISFEVKYLFINSSKSSEGEVIQNQDNTLRLLVTPKKNMSCNSTHKIPSHHPCYKWRDKSSICSFSNISLFQIPMFWPLIISNYVEMHSHC